MGFFLAVTYSLNCIKECKHNIDFAHKHLLKRRHTIGFSRYIIFQFEVLNTSWSQERIRELVRLYDNEGEDVEIKQSGSKD